MTGLGRPENSCEPPQSYTGTGVVISVATEALNAAATDGDMSKSQYS